MKCDVCEKREATALITMIVNGKKSMRRLCQLCVRRMQSGDAYATTMAVLATMEPADAEITCPVCGMKASDFQRTGRVGCAMCYDAFSGVMSPLFTRISAAPKKEDETPAEEPQASEKESQIKALREEMFAAVSAEEYERAAQLRDTIRRLESEGGDVVS